MNRFVNRVRGILVAILVLSLLPSTKTYAAPKLMEDGTYFDAVFYAEKYPDVSTALGTSEEAMWKHYREFGRNEGRLPYDMSTLGSISNANSSTYDKIMAMQVEYPEGMTWNYDNKYSSPNRKRDINIGLEASACQAFAYIVFDRIWGTDVYVHYKDAGVLRWVDKKAASLGPGEHLIDLTEYLNSGVDFDVYKNQYWAQLRCGDLLTFGDHIVVVLSNNGDSVTVCEGNYNGKIHWGRVLSKEYLFRFPFFCVETSQW